MWLCFENAVEYDLVEKQRIAAQARRIKPALNLVVLGAGLKNKPQVIGVDMNRLKTIESCGCFMQGDECGRRFVAEDGRLSVFFYLKHAVRFCGRLHEDRFYVLVLSQQFVSMLSELPLPADVPVRMELGSGIVFEQNYDVSGLPVTIREQSGRLTITVPVS